MAGSTCSGPLEISSGKMCVQRGSRSRVPLIPSRSRVKEKPQRGSRSRVSCKFGSICENRFITWLQLRLHNPRGLASRESCVAGGQTFDAKVRLQRRHPNSSTLRAQRGVRAGWVGKTIGNAGSWDVYPFPPEPISGFRCKGCVTCVFVSYAHRLP